MSTPSKNLPVAFARLDEELFHAWQAGDEAARADAWLHMCRLLYSMAVGLCRHFAPEQQTAEDWASQAITDAWLDVDHKLRNGLSWDGEALFAGLLASRVVFQCRRRCRAYFRSGSRLDDLLGVADDERDERLEGFVPVRPSQGLAQLAVASTAEAIADLVSRLAAIREMCRSRKALVEVVDAMLAYVRECCARAVDCVDTTAMSLAELVPLVNREAFDASQADMNRFIMERLKIGRNALDTRRADIRERVERAADD